MILPPQLKQILIVCACLLAGILISDTFGGVKAFSDGFSRFDALVWTLVLKHDLATCLSICLLPPLTFVPFVCDPQPIEHGQDTRATDVAHVFFPFLSDFDEMNEQLLFATARQVELRRDLLSVSALASGIVRVIQEEELSIPKDDRSLALLNLTVDLLTTIFRDGCRAAQAILDLSFHIQTHAACTLMVDDTFVNALAYRQWISTRIPGLGALRTVSMHHFARLTQGMQDATLATVQSDLSLARNAISHVTVSLNHLSTLVRDSAFCPPPYARIDSPDLIWHVHDICRVLVEIIGRGSLLQNMLETSEGFSAVFEDASARPDVGTSAETTWIVEVVLRTRMASLAARLRAFQGRFPVFDDEGYQCAIPL
ncbi:hypothetical protein PYCCODRAFT_1421901 [Trametes coccinea BRFM310]|uniref:Uncharacterized protein n=1 Tax=Trametes coccinea (strain BRFM310) TaxID=1353009 RepID=A0A1Y2J5P1_TRAC3|nr:hypothetical protein PYCCODRAFT_1421901 [Trametes coccinea BRFM310]